ncbi:hypothetical protein A2Z33_06270 [Candidatus Gottesmanbacteria bacterium RBG_16_52_11]|uniref:Uncharacterized protein n=1 Tax=Candidatus Gottesmanbacteria bacterium RBG_16_52_11 TaxID=1798374 RepID=A0A1F5YXF4_9BACT|nr:MAG: hypothetical protein A2Z33_06270 [Candidatus Gottesmanbacteria bacterium RBG_16_52_11]
MTMKIFNDIPEDVKDKVDKWLGNISGLDSLIKINDVVRALQTESDLIGGETFHIPLKRLANLRVEDREAIFQKLMAIGILIAGTDQVNVDDKPSLANEETSWVAVHTDRLAYVLNQLQEKINILGSEETNNTSSQIPQVIKLPYGWRLEEKMGMAELLNNNEIRYTFKMLARKPYKYFLHFCINYGKEIGYPDLVRLDSSVTEHANHLTHKNVRSVRSYLNKLFKKSKIPFEILLTNERFSLTIHR